MTTVKHLLLTTVEDPWDPGSWSGIPYSLRVALSRKVEQLSVFRPGPPLRNPVDVAKRIWYGGTPPKYPLWMTVAALKKTAREVQAHIRLVKPEAVLSISSQCVAYLNSSDVPIFMISDAPWLAWREAYAKWESMPIPGPRFAEDEARAAQRLDGLYFGSEWACKEGMRLYSTDADLGRAELAKKLQVVPFGANWTPQMPRDGLLKQIEERAERLAYHGRIELLFVGRDWERKGGPMAVEVASLLHKNGRKVRLHLVGCNPELPREIRGGDGFVVVHGLLNQTDPEQNAKLMELFLQSHFLIVPTTAECYGIVFAEAQAFGLPTISRSVHAVPSVVLDGQTGMLFEEQEPSSTYVGRIVAVVDEREAYLRMALKARDRFETQLNWDRTAELIVENIGLKSAGKRT